MFLSLITYVRTQVVTTCTQSYFNNNNNINFELLKGNGLVGCDILLNPWNSETKAATVWCLKNFK